MGAEAGLPPLPQRGCRGGGGDGKRPLIDKLVARCVPLSRRVHGQASVARSPVRFFSP